jgi:non-ribosomal peptide synthetase component E (peptide arylation enzyme)
MMIEFTRWPEAFAARYRQKGYWQDLPLTHLITRHAENDAPRLSTATKATATVNSTAWWITSPPRCSVRA